MGNYKVVGDKVKIKSLDWYVKNKDKDNSVCLEKEWFVPEMSKHCGEIATIISTSDDGYYRIDLDGSAFLWVDEMFENRRDIWKMGKLFVIVDEEDKEIFPDFYTTRKEAVYKLWEITKKEIK